MNMNADSVLAVRKALDALNSGDVSSVGDFISPDYVNHDSCSDPERAGLLGPEDFKSAVRWLHAAFADLRFEEQEIYPSGDMVIVRAVMSGRHVGEFLGVPPTGNTISSQQIHIFRVADGKPVEHRAVRDDLGTMMQMGLLLTWAVPDIWVSIV